MPGTGAPGPSASVSTACCRLDGTGRRMGSEPSKRADCETSAAWPGATTGTVAIAGTPAVPLAAVPCGATTGSAATAGTPAVPLAAGPCGATTGTAAIAGIPAQESPPAPAVTSASSSSISGVPCAPCRSNHRNGKEAPTWTGVSGAGSCVPGTGAPGPSASGSTACCGIDGRSRRTGSEPSKWAAGTASAANTISKVPALEEPPGTPRPPAPPPVPAGLAAPARMPLPTTACITRHLPGRSCGWTSGWSTSPRHPGSGWSGRARERRWLCRCPGRWRCAHRRS